MKVSKKSQRIKSFIAMDVMERAGEMQKAGEDVISLSLGEPDFPPPECVKRACIEAIEGNFTKYTHSQGMIELREAIAEHYGARYGVRVHPDQICVTAGSSPAFFLVFAALLNPGDEVILSDPHYPCYPNFIDFLGGKCVTVRVREEDRFQYRPEAVRKKVTRRTKAVLVNSPSNPTGYLVPDKTFEELAKMPPFLVSDEIYHGLVYERRERSALEFTDRAFVLNGFSKAYAMTGFRLGYVIAPKEFVRPMQKMQQNFSISVNAFVQRAGIAALREGAADQERMRKAFAERRRVTLEELRRIGLRPSFEPEGAFYVFVSIKDYTKDSYTFAFDCLKKAKVGITPGIDFGKGGEGYIRISYANSIEKIREGIRRLGKYLNQYSK
jgi:(5-formylfuran-3-yl)methyl phosphate transaminase